ncbi:conserved hypothetical protein [Culex quinquefasciatus]|uniref:MADS-box domain-containing protein n=1 Tax=Culex quinquefasciatus TaxID=7176 RepID=B0WLY6_CULQU|nr:conserved hypothetical protein [Culex quinquefasciatus]|eukprot:XP_001849720.1 conserved hypothetical protein [Culex quinquefasciatus]
MGSIMTARPASVSVSSGSKHQHVRDRAAEDCRSARERSCPIATRTRWIGGGSGKLTEPVTESGAGTRKKPDLRKCQLPATLENVCADRITRAVPVDNPRAVNLPLVPVPRKAAKIWEIMDPNAARDSRYNLNYSMSMMSETPEIYGNPNVSLARPPSGGLVGQVMSRGGQLMSANGPQCGSGAGGGGGGGGGGLSGGRGIKRANSDCYDDGRQLVGSQSGGMTGLEGCQVGGSDVVDESYTSLQPKKSPPSNGKKTKGRVKIKMEYIDNKLRRYTTFSKRKTGIMKKRAPLEKNFFARISRREFGQDASRGLPMINK